MSDLNGTYDAVAPTYDEWSVGHWFPDTRAPWARKLADYVSAGDKVIELGCGTGVPVGRVLAARYDYAGVDASSGMLQKAREALPGIPLVRADMLAVQFSPGSLGAVVAFNSIPNTPRECHASLFRTVASWLCPGGVFVGNVLQSDNDTLDDWHGLGPMRESGFDDDISLDFLRAAGLTVVESEWVGHHPRESEATMVVGRWFVARRGD